MIASNKFPRKDGYVAIAIWVTIVLLYGYAYEAGFVTDFTGLWEKMKGKGLADALQSFGFPSLMPLLNVMYFGLARTVGQNALVWFLVFSFFYAYGLYHFYKLTRLLLARVGAKNEQGITLLTVLLVLTSPYQVEAMIWKVGLGHLASVAWFMAALHYGIKYLDQKQLRSSHHVPHLLLRMALLLAASLLCFEWGICFPIMLTLLSLIYTDKVAASVRIRSILVSVAVVIVYLGMTYLILGKPIGHYEVELSGWRTLEGMYATSWKYWMKHLFYVHYWPGKAKVAMYAIADNTVFMSLSLVVLCGSMMWLWCKGKGLWRLLAVMIACAFVALLLVSPLFFVNVYLTENDRYGSLFVPFFSLAVVLLLSRLPYRIWVVMVGGLIIFNLVLQRHGLSRWNTTHDIISELIDDFPADVSEHTFILNLPDNLRGTPMLRDYAGGNPLMDKLSLSGREVPEMDLAVQYNIGEFGQGFSAAYASDSTIILQMKEWGSWWFRNGMGVKSYATENYSVDAKGRTATIKLLRPEQYKQILYTDGLRWQMLKPKVPQSRN